MSLRTFVCSTLACLGFAAAEPAIDPRGLEPMAYSIADQGPAAWVFWADRGYATASPCDALPIDVAIELLPAETWQHHWAILQRDLRPGRPPAATTADTLRALIAVPQARRPWAWRSLTSSARLGGDPTVQSLVRRGARACTEPATYADLDDPQIAVAWGEDLLALSADLPHGLPAAPVDWPAWRREWWQAVARLAAERDEVARGALHGTLLNALDPADPAAAWRAWWHAVRMMDVLPEDTTAVGSALDRARSILAPLAARQPLYETMHQVLTAWAIGLRMRGGASPTVDDARWITSHLALDRLVRSRVHDLGAATPWAADILRSTQDSWIPAMLDALATNGDSDAIARALGAGNQAFSPSGRSVSGSVRPHPSARIIDRLVALAGNDGPPQAVTRLWAPLKRTGARLPERYITRTLARIMSNAASRDQTRMRPYLEAYVAQQRSACDPDLLVTATALRSIAPDSPDLPDPPGRIAPGDTIDSLRARLPATGDAYARILTHTGIEMGVFLIMGQAMDAQVGTGMTPERGAAIEAWRHSTGNVDWAHERQGLDLAASAMSGLPSADVRALWTQACTVVLALGNLQPAGQELAFPGEIRSRTLNNLVPIIPVAVWRSRSDPALAAALRDDLARDGDRLVEAAASIGLPGWIPEQAAALCCLATNGYAEGIVPDAATLARLDRWLRRDAGANPGRGSDAIAWMLRTRGWNGSSVAHALSLWRGM